MNAYLVADTLPDTGNTKLNKGYKIPVPFDQQSNRGEKKANYNFTNNFITLVESAYTEL